MSAARQPVLLVVEDDSAVRDLLCELFTDSGYGVLVASNGAKALEIMETVRPDGMTLDLDLPGINGIQVLEIMRQHEWAQGLPVVIVSAKLQVPEDVTALAQAVIPKPFTVDELLAVVEQLIPPPESFPDSAEAADAGG